MSPARTWAEQSVIRATRSPEREVGKAVEGMVSALWLARTKADETRESYLEQHLHRTLGQVVAQPLGQPHCRQLRLEPRALQRLRIASPH